MLNKILTKRESRTVDRENQKEEVRSKENTTKKKRYDRDKREELDC